MPFNDQETIAGYGVVKNDPWHFAGIFPTKAEAEAKASQLGSDYKVKYGENRKGTDDFVWTDSDNA